VKSQYIFELEDTPILVAPVPPPPFSVQAWFDKTGVFILAWHVDIGNLITVEISTSLLLTNWIVVPGSYLEFSVFGQEKQACHIGPLSPPIFFRLKWNAP